MQREISRLKDRVSRLGEEIQELKVKPLAQGQAQAQVQAQVEAKDDVVKLGCVIQDLEVFHDKAPPTIAKSKD